MPPIQIRATKASIVLTGASDTIPASPIVFVFPGTQCTLELSEDSEQLNRLGNGVEPSREVFSGIKTISSNLEAVLNYDTAAFMLGVSVGMPATTTEVATANWMTGVTVAPGEYVKGITPATDDLYCIVGGTTGAIAPDTTLKLQDEEIDDNGVVWVVYKSRVKNATSGIKACLPTFAIEYEFKTCDDELVYFRTIGNAAASISMSIEKKTVPKVTIATNGSSVEDSITNLAYETLADKTPSQTIIIDDMNDVSNYELGFVVGNSTTYPVFTFSITSDNAQEEKNPLNQPRYFITGLRSVSGNMAGGWDSDIYKAMKKHTDTSLSVVYDNKRGRSISLALGKITLPLSAPSFEAGMVSNLDVAYKAFGTSAESALIWTVKSTQVDF